MKNAIKAVIFDFGGVLAEEGFREGLLAIGRKNGLPPEEFRKTADDLIHETGYVTGNASEHAYWEKVRAVTGITGTDDELRSEIMERFVLRTELIDIVQRIKSNGLLLAVLSDQTNWLDEINERTPFFEHFQYVFNSYRIRKSKRDSTVFGDVCTAIGIDPNEGLFIDDNIDNVQRASHEGLQVIQYRDMESFKQDIAAFLNHS